MKLPPELTNDPDWPGFMLVLRMLAWSYISLFATFCVVLVAVRWAPLARDVAVAATAAWCVFREVSIRMSHGIPPARGR